MNKIKLNSGLAALVFIACLFLGWQTLLLVTILALVFCEIDEKVKNVITKVITFYAAYTLISMGWNLIYDGINLIFGSLNSVIAIINSYLEPIDAISMAKIDMYLIGPIKLVLGVLNQVVVYLLAVAKFAFILNIFTGKNIKESPISKKISEYVSKIMNYVSNFSNSQTNSNVAQQNYAQQPTMQQMVNTQPINTQANIQPNTQQYNNTNM